MEPPDKGQGEVSKRVSKGLVRKDIHEDLRVLPGDPLSGSATQTWPLFARPREPQQQRLFPTEGLSAQHLGLDTRTVTAAPPAGMLAQPVREGRKRRGKKEGEGGVKKRARKPADSPRRPKSAYMFFLAEFREEWKTTHPESRKVADVAKAAGEKWRGMSDKEKVEYEKMSTESKALYAREMEKYRTNKARYGPPQRARGEEEMALEPKPEQGGYHYFLRDFREAWKKEHPNEAADRLTNAKQAAETWKSMTPEERHPFEHMFRLFGPLPRVTGESTDIQGTLPVPHTMPTMGPSLESYGIPGTGLRPEAPLGGQEPSSRKDPMNPPRDTLPE